MDVFCENDKCMKTANNEMKADRDEWKKTYCADPKFEYDSIRYQKEYFPVSAKRTKD